MKMRNEERNLGHALMALRTSSYTTEEVDEAIEAYKADAQALADVRTLDGQGSWELDEAAEGWLVLGDDRITLNRKREETPELARAAAAKAIRSGAA